MGYDVFVSYSSNDRAIADAVVAALEAAGVACWTAPRDISPGEEWAEAIIRGLNQSRAMVLVFSAHANQSPQIKREVERAVHRGMPLVPLRVDAARPVGSFEYFLMTPHWLDASSPPFQQHLEGLVRSVKGLLSPGEPARLDPVSANLAGGSGVASATPTAPRALPLPKWRTRWLAAAASAVLAVALAVAAWAVMTGRETVTGSRGEGARPEHSVPPAPVMLPPRVAGLPAADVLRVVYESTPPPLAPAGGGIPPSVQVGLFARRAGSPDFVALNDGEQLASDVDQYVLAARALSPGHLYVFQVDSSGRVDWLFPRNDASAYSAGSNPLAGGQSVRVPEDHSGLALTLDRTEGVEHVYFVFTAEPWPELERALADRPLTLALRGGGERAGAASVAEPNRLGLRGVGGTAVAADALPAAEMLQGKGVEAAATGPLVVVERWFRHVGR